MIPLKVALLAEGVDRNPNLPPPGLIPGVALLAEGVDRNGFMYLMTGRRVGSPSSQRAWIEI